ncbi:MAG: sigma-E processing peptidase SpoIIGA [Alicyclobacillaceae bacterium]|nr:sigma-E processing peptidase SpoIIGA [Alicyclobacillaceae bacterium]
MPVVYLDVVWLVNFAMDAVLLAVTSWIGKRPVRVGRIAGGALIGSLYSLLLFFPPLSLLTTWPGKAVVSLLMVAVAVPWRSWLDLARLCALFYAAAFVLAGAAVALHFAVPGVSAGQGWVVSGSRLAVVVSAKTLLLLLAIPLGAAVLRYAWGYTRRIQLEAELTCAVRVVVAGQVAELTGLIDTGNRLRDPVTRAPVCLVDADAVAPLLPDALRRALGSRDWFAALAQLDDEEWTGRLSLVPYQGAGQQQALAVAFRPDEVAVRQGGTWQVVEQRCLFALYPGRLSVERQFQAILHSELVTGDDRFGHNAESATAHSPAAVVDPHPPEARWRA